jgi:hypothetical protein
MLEGVQARQRVSAGMPVFRQLPHEIALPKMNVDYVVGQWANVDHFNRPKRSHVGYKSIDARSNVDMSHRTPLVNPVCNQ